MENTFRKNPWLGLESYQEGEILYGRDDDIRALSQCVINDKETLLYGKSGIGKSSIMNAGVIPAARRNDFVPILIRLSHKEEHSYLDQIKNAIENALVPIPSDRYGNPKKLSAAEDAERHKLLKTVIRNIAKRKDSNTDSIYEYFHRHSFYNEKGERIKLLLVFDQFEEIFTLQSSEIYKKQFFTDLAYFLNDIMPEYLQPQNTSDIETSEKSEVVDINDFDNLFSDIDLSPENEIEEYVNDNVIHIVFTIREDFLSEFDYYSASIPSLRRNRYCLRPINEEQAAQIILRPIPGLIEQNVAKLIIEKVTGRKDFSLDGIPEIEVDSAVLSLYLNRLFEARVNNSISSDIVEDKGSSIISDFYLDAISEISESSIVFLEEKLINGQGRRDNIAVYDAIHYGGISASELDILCNKRKILRQFNYAGDLRLEFVHDILCPVVKAHKEERTLLKQKEQERLRQEEEKRKILEEEENKRIEIERNAAKEKQRLEEEAKKIKEKNRKTIITIITIVAIIAVGFYLGWIKNYYENEKEYIEYYAQFENRYGWPTGIGEPIPEEILENIPLYYKLSHKGNKYGNRHTMVEVVSSNKYLPNTTRVPKLEWSNQNTEDKRENDFNSISKIITKIKYSATGDGKSVEKEDYYDKFGHLLMTLSYFHFSDDASWIHYYTSDGGNMKIRDNGLDRAKISWDSIGRISTIKYYNAQGIPKEIEQKSNIFGYMWKYFGDTVSIRYSLNEYGALVTQSDSTFNAIYTTEMTDGMRMTYLYYSSTSNSASIKEVSGPEGYSTKIEKKNKILLFKPNSRKPFETKTMECDSKGNIVLIKTEGEHLNTAPIVRYKYHDGLITKQEFLKEDKKTPFGDSPRYCYLNEYNYNDNGDVIEEKHTNIAGNIEYHWKKSSRFVDNLEIVIKECSSIGKDNMADIKYSIQIDTISKLYSSTTYYGKNNIPINQDIKDYNNDTMRVHRIVSRKDSLKLTVEYYSYDNNKIQPLQTKLNEYGSAISYFRRTEEYDSNGNKTSLTIEDDNGRIIKSMMYFNQNGQQIWQAVKGIDGEPVRCDKWETDGYLYYKCYSLKDFNGEFSAFKVVDEWNHTSAIYDCLQKQYFNIAKYNVCDERIFVEDSVGRFTIRGNYDYEFTITQPDINLSDREVPYIHVLSKNSKMYNKKNGVLDGDRIARFNDWNFGDNLKKLNFEWNKALSKENQEIKIDILRPVISENKFVFISKTIKSDLMSNEYIEYHILRLSKEEENFITPYLKN